MRKLFFLMFVLLLALTSLAEDQPKNMAFGTKLKSVAVFRDGFGYYVREGQVKLENGWATTNFVPTAIRGTVWIYSVNPADKVDTVITTHDNKIEFGSPGEIKAKLADKMNLKLMVVTKSGQKFEGELAKILDDMLLLRSGSAYNAVPYDQVSTISFVGYPIRVKIASKDPNKVCTLGIGYLQDGIRWEPSYVLSVTGGNAKLTLRASMTNTTENLDKSDVLFVVGSPFVANRGLQDMIAFMPASAQAGAAIAENDLQPGRPEERKRELEPKSESTVKMASVTGDEVGELYFYKKDDLSLATNDVAMVSIFDMTVPVTPQFEWNADGDEVAYLLSLKNSSDQPLTTGPVFVVEDGRAVGQEMIRYTPAGSSAEVRLSRGIGLRVERTEAEVKRGSPVKIGKTDFIPVTLKGTLTITNFRKEVSPVKVTKTVRGRVVSKSDEGALKQTQVLTGDPNPINDLEWNVKIAPGQVKIITYTIEMFMSAERAGSPPVPGGFEGLFGE